MSEAGTPPPARTIAIFFAYSHKDEALRDELEKHLAILSRSGVISSWHDRKISGGVEWNEEIDDYLNRADIILLLVSVDFLASNYCYEREMKRAIERHKMGEARVIPILLRPCDWEGAPFGKFQGFPKDFRPVTLWVSQDEAFRDVAIGIRKVAEELSRTPRKIFIPVESPNVQSGIMEGEPSQATGESLGLKWRTTPQKLVLQGPHVDVVISAARPEQGRAIGFDYPALRVRALIDTGASLTIINPQIAATCKLQQTDWNRIATVGGGLGEYPAYAASISFPGGSLPAMDVVRVVACPIIGQPFFSCLIGRDILRNWHITYDGPNGDIQIRMR